MGIPRIFGGGRAVQRGSHAGDRRRACRYRVVFQDTLLGWWQDACFVNVSAHLVDLSTTGCLAELAADSKLTTEPIGVGPPPRGFTGGMDRRAHHRSKQATLR